MLSEVALRMEIKLKKNLHHWLGNFDKRGCVAQEPRGAITAKRGSCAFGEVPSTHACPLAKCNAANHVHAWQMHPLADCATLCGFVLMGLHKMGRNRPCVGGRNFVQVPRACHGALGGHGGS